jgi:DivIVA domain-containing protein
MELSPQAITGVEFSQVRKGYDAEEVKSFLTRLAAGLEEMRSHLVASDARARAAMARVQELQGREPAGDTEVISKTLLLAQRTADSTVGDARKIADELITGADVRSKAMIAEADATAAETVRQAELQARNHTESELRTLNERRGALQAEVEQLNDRIVAERERVAAVIESLQRLLRSPEGLGTLGYRSSTASYDAPDAPDAYGSAPAAEAEVASLPVRLIGQTDRGLGLTEGSTTGEVPLIDPWNVN